MKRRTAAVGFVLTALIAVGVLFVGASSGSAASPDITFDLTCSPGSITGGADANELGCDGLIENGGPQTATQMAVVLEVPGATLLKSSFAAGACEPVQGGGTSCDLPLNLQRNDDFSFTTIFDGVGAGTIRAYVRFHEGASESDVGKQDTVCANGGGVPPCPAADSVSVIAAGDADDEAGDYVAFAGVLDTLATTGLPSIVGEVVTDVKIPFRSSFSFGFGATIDDTATDSACHPAAPTGTVCFGQAVTTAQFPGEFLTTDPVVVTFKLIAPNGKNDKTIGILHNGFPAPSCAKNPLSSTVDTCVRRDLGSTTGGSVKTVTLVVHTTENGDWDFF